MLFFEACFFLLFIQDTIETVFLRLCSEVILRKLTGTGFINLSKTFISVSFRNWKCDEYFKGTKTTRLSTK